MSVATEFDGSESLRDQIESKYGQYDPEVPDESTMAYPISTAGCAS